MNAASDAGRYPTEPLVCRGELPDLFLQPDGRRVATRADWPARARAWRDLVLDMEYGGLPPPPEAVETETLCRSGVRRWPQRPRLWSLRVHCRGGEQPFHFGVRLLFPEDPPEPPPVIVSGDGCWWYITEDVARAVIDRGCALVLFNRTEMAADLGHAKGPDNVMRRGGLYEVYPDRTFGALSAWAWGYHRVVDMLESLGLFDTRRIAVTGHSRGGKTVLLAGATDDRIALVNDNASCAAGSAVFRYVGAGGETLNIVNSFPSWFGPGLRPYLHREEELPFDQHCLLASIAPRRLLITYALDDRWSNPEGMVQSFWAAREAYRFLGKEDNLAFHLRPGPHQHAPEDWEVLLDTIDRHWQGKDSGRVYNRHPYSHLKPHFSWKAPGPAGEPGFHDASGLK